MFHALSSSINFASKSRRSINLRQDNHNRDQSGYAAKLLSMENYGETSSRVRFNDDVDS